MFLKKNLSKKRNLWDNLIPKILWRKDVPKKPIDRNYRKRAKKI